MQLAIDIFKIWILLLLKDFIKSISHSQLPIMVKILLYCKFRVQHIICSDTDNVLYFFIDGYIFICNQGDLSNAEAATMTLEEFSKIVPNGKPSKWHYVQDELFINRHEKLKDDIKESVSKASVCVCVYCQPIYIYLQDDKIK